MQEVWQHQHREKRTHGDRSAAVSLPHCRACGVYTVTGDRARERVIKMEIVDKLHRERVSQRGMARVTGISRPTIKRWLRKKDRAPSVELLALLLPCLRRGECDSSSQNDLPGRAF
jgi:hypothetical protein